MKKYSILAIIFVFFSSQSFAETATFKVLKNDPRKYTEESVRLKTTKGDILVYSVYMSPKNYRVFKSLKKDQCFAMTINGKFKKYDNTYAVGQLKNIKNVKCSNQNL